VNNSAGAKSGAEDDTLSGRERDIGEYIRQEPLTALAIAGGVGFIIGGGANSRIGLALLTLVGRIALRGAATNFVVDLVTGNHDNQGPDRAKARGGSHRNGNHDNGRADFGDPD